MNHFIREDAEYVVNNTPMDRFAGCTVLVTGATGLIGQLIVRSFLVYNEIHEEKIRVIACVRNPEKAIALFGQEPEYLVSDIKELKAQNLGVEYMIHSASVTSSKTFVEHPAETIDTAYTGLKNVLEFARVNPVKSMIYLSTMEVYGSPQTDEKITENHGTDINTMQVRSSYPESKRLCESLCTAYCHEYGVPVKVIRLTQTFGPGADYNDSRVFAEFARCVIENRDIILHTKGDTRRSYLYTADAVSAIMYVLVNGSHNEAYNAANEDSYCSILEMAEIVSKHCAENKIRVCIEETENHYGYAPVLHMNLDTSKLQALGWKAEFSLTDMFDRMIGYLTDIRIKSDG